MKNTSRRRFLTALAAGGAAAAAPSALPAAGSAARARAGFADGRELGLTAGAGHDQSAALKRAIGKAAGLSAVLVLPPGPVLARDVEVSGPVRIVGAPGARLVCAEGGGSLLSVASGPVRLEGLAIDGRNARAGGEEDGLVTVEDCVSLKVRDCAFSGGAGNGLMLRRCHGVVEDSRFSAHGRAGVFSLHGRNVRITGNHVSGCGANGIMVWQPRKGPDGAVVAHNVIAGIRNDPGGNGPCGNGVNVFRASGVRVTGNEIRDCAYSAVRVNSGDDCVITGNDCETMGEVAIFVEFAFRGVIVSGNDIRRASAGVSVTNLDQGGRLATVSGNIIRGIFPRISSQDVLGYGVWAEAETAVTGNVVEEAKTAGLWLGWGAALRNVTAAGNILRRCGVGVAVSVAAGAGKAAVTGNLIERAARGAVVGFDHEKPVTGDLTARGARPPGHLLISANL